MQETLYYGYLQTRQKLIYRIVVGMTAPPLISKGHGTEKPALEGEIDRRFKEEYLSPSLFGSRSNDPILF